MISGLNEFSHPSSLKMMYWGTSVTWEGSIIVANTRTKTASRPGHSTREKPKAMKADEIRVPVVAITV